MAAKSTTSATHRENVRRREDMFARAYDGTPLQADAAASRYGPALDAERADSMARARLAASAYERHGTSSVCSISVSSRARRTITCMPIALAPTTSGHGTI